MITAFFSLAALAILASSIFKTSRILREFEVMDDQSQKLQEKFQSTRIHLRKKLNRLVVMQRRQAGESTPTVTFQKLGKTVPALFASDTIYSIAEDEGFGLSGTCEGNGDCALCVITIVSGAENITAMSEDEAAILKQMEKPPGCRLSCQSKVRGDMVVDFLEF